MKLFTPFSFSALLLFVAAVSGAPLRQPSSGGVIKHTDRTLRGLTLDLAQSPEKHVTESLVHAASEAPVIVHVVPGTSSRDSPADFELRQQYARSPAIIAGVHQAHGRVAEAHAAAATAHRAAAASLWAVATDRRYRGDYARAEAARSRGTAHVAVARKHDGKEVVHKHLEDVFRHRTLPLKGTAADGEVEKANASGESARGSTEAAARSVAVA